MGQSNQEIILSELERLRGEFQKVIDIGCGGGTLIRTIVQEFGVIGVGIDKKSSKVSSAESEAIANNLADKISFSEQRAEELSFGDESFDVAVSSLCIHELDDQVGGLREICRVLKPDGVFVCVDWTKAASVSHGQRPLAPQQMQEYCKEAGFREVSAEYLDEKRIFCLAKR